MLADRLASRCTAGWSLLTNPRSLQGGLKWTSQDHAPGPVRGRLTLLALAQTPEVPRVCLHSCELGVDGTLQCSGGFCSWRAGASCSQRWPKHACMQAPQPKVVFLQGRTLLSSAQAVLHFLARLAGSVQACTGVCLWGMSELQTFILRGEVVKLYRTFLRTVRQAPAHLQGTSGPKSHLLAEKGLLKRHVLEAAVCR